MPEGLWISSEARSTRSQTLWSTPVRSRQVRATVCGPAVTEIGTEGKARIDIELQGVEAFVERKLMIVRSADFGRVHDLIVEQHEEFMRPVVTFDAEQALLDAAHEPAAENVLAVGREVVRDLDTAARAERQARHVVILRGVEGNGVGGAGRQALPGCPSPCR